MKIVNINEENILISELLEEIFRKDVTYDRIKSQSPYPLSRRYIFVKTTGGKGSVPTF